MRIGLASVALRDRSSSLHQSESRYVCLLKHYASITQEVFRSPGAILAAVERQRSFLVLLDSRGRQFGSEQFAAWLGQRRDSGVRSICFAVGPADGWGDEMRARADLLLSLGPMTLPHELARVVLAEQVYRAFTILAGHPYHTGHQG